MISPTLPLTRNHRLLAAVVVVLCGWCEARAFADEANHPASSERPENGYWSEGTPRFFFTQRSELGAPYLKPYVSVGYGLPHWIWAGLDANAITTLEFLQTYVGVRAATPVLDFAFGARHTWSYNKPFLAPSDRFTSASVLDAGGDKAQYWAWEAEVVGILPLPHAALLADFIAVGAWDVPRGRYFYDESYRAVVKDPTFFILRVAAVARFMNENAFKVGVLTETVFGTGRGQPIVRVGPALSIQLTDHLELNAAVTVAVSSPDDLGLVLGAYGVGGLRYRWSTGERRPAWPWNEKLIP